MRGQGSIAVMALVLMVVLTAVVALYILTSSKLVELSNDFKQVVVEERLALSEKINVSVVSYDYVSVSLGPLYSFTLVHVVVQLSNVGSVSTAVENAVVSCHSSTGENLLSVPMKLGILALQPGASRVIDLNIFLALYCSEISVTFVSMYGNGYTIYVPVS